MTTTKTMTLPMEREGFRIVDRPEGIFVFGSIPMDWMSAIIEVAKGRGFDYLDTGSGSTLGCWVFTDDAGRDAVRAAIAAENESKHGDNKLAKWRDSTDIGISSLTIAHVLGGTTMGNNISDIPRDPSDFGRCLRLVRLMGRRERLPEVVSRHPAWKPFVWAWDELERLYDEESPSGNAPRLYREMKNLAIMSRTTTGLASSVDGGGG